jgi:adenylate kinase
MAPNSPGTAELLTGDTVEMSRLGDTQEFSVPPRLINPPQTILLGGLQGAGKGTNSSRLRKREGIQTYVSSDKMREHASYPELKAMMDAGILVPDDKIFRILDDYLDTRERLAAALVNGSKLEAMRTAFDGAPRTIGQKKRFDEIMERRGLEPAWAVKLHLDDDPKVADEIARASVRYRARRDAANGAPRSDDTNPETVERRIKGYHTQTEPLFDQYGEQGRLIVIDAKPNFDYDTLDIEDDATFDATAEAIYARLVHALNNRGQ